MPAGRAPYQPPFGDEGRAILQVIHAIAPVYGFGLLVRLAGQQWQSERVTFRRWH